MFVWLPPRPEEILPADRVKSKTERVNVIVLLAIPPPLPVIVIVWLPRGVVLVTLMVRRALNVGVPKDGEIVAVVLPVSAAGTVTESVISLGLAPVARVAVTVGMIVLGDSATTGRPIETA